MVSASLYDRLERALIALEYALADARSLEQRPIRFDLDRVAKSQDELLSAGEEVQEVLLALKAAALRDAATRAREWT
jgi:hypothetical protein